VVVTGDHFTPNAFVFFKVVGTQTGELYHDQTVTADNTGFMPSTWWDMCLQGADTSATITAQDEETGLWSNSWAVTPVRCNP
jgi:hypothetical protein